MTVVDTVFGKMWKLQANVAGGITNRYNGKMTFKINMAFGISVIIILSGVENMATKIILLFLKFVMRLKCMESSLGLLKKNNQTS